MNALTYSSAGRKLTETYEGFRAHAYQDQGGVLTVGYGHTGKGVGPNTVVTLAQADMMLAGDVLAAAACVNQGVSRSLAQCEFDALVDFTFNVGRSAFLNSRLRESVEVNFLPEVRIHLLAWDEVNGVASEGLYHRRCAEYAMYSGIGASL